MKLKILAVATLIITVCSTSLVKAQTRTFTRVLETQPAQQQLIETKQCQACQLYGIDLNNADLRGANLAKAELSSAKLNGANFESANLVEAELYNTELNEAKLANAKLGQAHLVTANLTNANLKSADLTKAYLNSANLTNANLANANLVRADLTAANLNGANFRAANLSKADLRNADLRGADLSQANLSHAYLKGAKLEAANLNGAILPPSNKPRSRFLPLALLFVVALLWYWRSGKTARSLSSLFWQGVLLAGSALSGWILSVFTAPAYGWILVMSGAVIATLAGLLDGWHTRNLKQKKLKIVDRKGEVFDTKGAAFEQTAIVGLRTGLVAGLLAAIITWVVVLAGVIPFAQWGLEASWSWSWSEGLTFEQPGPVGLSGRMPWGVSFIPYAIMYAVIWPMSQLLTLTENLCKNGADVVGVGKYYFADLGTLAPALITVGVAWAVTATVAKTKIQSSGLDTLEVQTLLTVALVTCLGLVLGWVIDAVVLPGYGASLNLLMQQCPH